MISITFFSVLICVNFPSLFRNVLTYCIPAVFPQNQRRTDEEPCPLSRALQTVKPAGPRESSRAREVGDKKKAAAIPWRGNNLA
jgi:hypothetical protein